MTARRLLRACAAVAGTTLLAAGPAFAGDLSKSDSAGFPHDGGLDYAEAIITATETDRAGTARMSMTTRNDCDIRHHIRYRRNRSTLSFSAHCFSSPRWIAFNAWILTMDDRQDPTYLFGDHVFPVWSSDDTSVEQFTRRIRRPSAL